MDKNPIRPALFAFLRDLAANNNRDWFLANKERYEEEVREPLRAFVRAFEPHLFRISEQFSADDRRSGGSLLRIQRDVRFSHDKRPYKQNAALQFTHRGSGRDIHAPGFYLHLEPDSVFAGVGVWMPDTATARAIRETIAARPDEWSSATGAAFGRRWSVTRDAALKRVPPGFDAQSPHAEDLKLKSFTAFWHMTEKQACGKNFVAELADGFGQTVPFMRLLCTALELEW